MTKLSEFLPLEDIKKSKKLQGIETKKYHKVGKRKYKHKELPESIVEYREKSRWYDFYPALTIADIIDNSKELFGEIIETFPFKQKSGEVKLTNHIGVCTIILNMCFDNEPINEISLFIIENIKE